MGKRAAAAGILALLLVIVLWGLRSDPAPNVEAGASSEAAVQAIPAAQYRVTRTPGLDAGTATPTTDAGAITRYLELRGSVILDGEPASATVHLGSTVLSVGEDGKFAWGGAVEEKGLAVWAERGPLRSAAQRAIPGPRSPQLQLVLTQPIRVTGHLYGSPDRQPLAGIKVNVSNLGDGQAELTTDAKGAFSSDQVTPGFTGISTRGDADWAPRSQTFHLEAGRANEVELTLNRHQAVAGKVVNGSQQPIADATVRLHAVSTNDKRSTRSDADGFFRFDRVLAPAFVILAEHRTGRSRTLITPARADLVLVLAAAASLELTVTRQNGSVAGLECSLIAEGPIPPSVAFLTTGPEGQVRFEGLPPLRKWNIWVREGKARWHGLGATVTREGENTFTGEFKDDGRHVALTVLDGVDRSTIADAEVTIGTLTQTTGADGKAVFDDVDSGDNLKVTVNAEGYPESAFGLEKDDTEGELPLFRWRAVRGIAVDAADHPIRELLIDSRQVDTDRDGRFEDQISGSGNDESAELTCPGCARVTAKLPKGQADIDLGRVVIGEGGTFHFSVTTPDGKPAPFARLYKVEKAKDFLGSRERSEPRMLVDALGQARVKTATPSCTVAWLEGYAPSTRDSCPHQPKPGQTTKLELRLRRPAWVEGVARPNGRPAPNLLVGELEESSFVITDERGRYRLGPLSPGVHQLGVFSPADGLEWEMKPITVAEGTTQTVDFGPDAIARIVVEWMGTPSATLTAAALPGHLTVTRGRDLRVTVKP